MTENKQDVRHHFTDMFITSLTQLHVVETNM